MNPTPAVPARRTPTSAEGARAGRQRLGVAVCSAFISLTLTACGSTVAPTGGGAALPAGDGLGGPQAAGPALDDVTALDAAGTAVPGAAPGSAADPGAGPAAAPGPAGSGTAGSAAGSGKGTGSAAAGAGTSRPTGPVKVGVLTVKPAGEAVTAIGGTQQNSAAFSEQNLSRALVRALNAEGGVAGRRIEVVEYAQDAQSGNYATDMEAACATFTQDNDVDVVLRTQLGGIMSENYNSCLTRAGVTSLEMSFAVGDETYLKRHPRLYNIAAPSVDRRVRGALSGLHKSGYLSSKNKIGILVEDCPENQNAYKNTVAPLLKSLGLAVRTRSIGCLRGFSDVGAFSSQVQAAVLPFRSDGIDRVAFVSAWEVLMLLFFDTNARSQGYAPQYAITSNSPVGATTGQFSDEQHSRMRGIGWSPNTDTRAPALNASAKKCDAMLKKQGLTPQNQAEAALGRSVCDVFLYFKASVEAAGGRTDGESLSTGIAAAAKTYLSPSALGGRLQLDKGRQDGPSQVAEFDFADSCRCFRYISAPRALP